MSCPTKARQNQQLLVKITTPKIQKYEFLELIQNEDNFLDKPFAKHNCWFITEILLQKVKKNCFNPE